MLACRGIGASRLRFLHLWPGISKRQDAEQGKKSAGCCDYVYTFITESIGHGAERPVMSTILQPRDYADRDFVTGIDFL